VYEQHYGFSEKPFNLTPDPKYLFLSRRHTEAFAHLEFGRREKGGFILVSGEVGTGKTTLARYFLSRLDARSATAFVLYPAVTAVELLRNILEDLHVPVEGTTLKDHVDALHRFLLRARAEGREVILLIDEAQDLSPEVLEQVRLISNLETDTEKLIQIVLMGQSELAEMLARPQLRQLAQRVTARYHLTPLTRGETEEYVRHRLSVAGGEGKASFEPAALDALHGATQGIPRLINLVCDRALLGGFVEGTRAISAGLVRRAAAEVVPPPARRLPRALAATLAGAVAILAAVGFVSRGSDAPAAAAPAAGVAAGPAVAADALAPVLLTLPRDPSYRAALDAVEGLWGGGALERTSLRTHLEQIRRLDLPVVLEMFHPARYETCYVALLRVDGEHAVLSAGGTTVRASLAELDRHWTREATYVWRDFDALGQAGDPARNEWARRTLGRLGYAGPEADLGSAVARFQRDAELIADGVIGSRTLMTLYARAAYPRPRLAGES
jgi:general secretion pathway protein A